MQVNYQALHRRGRIAGRMKIQSHGPEPARRSSARGQSGTMLIAVRSCLLWPLLLLLLVGSPAPGDALIE